MEKSNDDLFQHSHPQIYTCNVCDSIWVVIIGRSATFFFFFLPGSSPLTIITLSARTLLLSSCWVTWPFPILYLSVPELNSSLIQSSITTAKQICFRLKFSVVWCIVVWWILLLKHWKLQPYFSSSFERTIYQTWGVNYVMQSCAKTYCVVVQEFKFTPRRESQCRMFIVHASKLCTTHVSSRNFNPSQVCRSMSRCLRFCLATIDSKFWICVVKGAGRP